jgi:hypothetical protein
MLLHEHTLQPLIDGARIAVNDHSVDRGIGADRRAVGIAHHGMLGSGASKESLAELARLEANLTDIDDSVFIRLSGPGLICFYMSLFCLYILGLICFYTSVFCCCLATLASPRRFLRPGGSILWGRSISVCPQFYRANLSLF